MAKLLDEIRYDLSFIKSHTLQPKWYKILKVFLLFGLIAGYSSLFGVLKTSVFFGVFVSMSFLIHMIYRVKTERFVKSWLDFVVFEENGALKYKRIGIFYYLAVFLSALIALGLSQLVSI
jgi:hypothetical protein